MGGIRKNLENSLVITILDHRIILSHLDHILAHLKLSISSTVFRAYDAYQSHLIDSLAINCTSSCVNWPLQADAGVTRSPGAQFAKTCLRNCLRRPPEVYKWEGTPYQCGSWMMFDFTWMDEEMTDTQRPQFEATAKMYCRLCDQHLITYWPGHISNSQHLGNKKRHKRLLYGSVIGAILSVALVMILVI